jgi:uncharacterized RDD family membrane protein YckC
LENVSINTSQNVQISYPIAGLSDRIFAFMIDFVIIISVTVVIVLVLSYTQVGESSQAVMLLTVFPFIFYHLVMEITMGGQSVGKKVMDIKVVKLNGTQATVGAFLLRWIIRPLDIFFYGGVAILCISVGGKGQRLGDMAAGTTVIKLKSSAFLKDHAISSTDENYNPVFKDADQLDSDYIDLINRAIKAKLEMLDDKPVEAIAAKTKQKLEIETDMPDLKFLHTVIKDYHHVKLKEQ